MGQVATKSTATYVLTENVRHAAGMKTRAVKAIVRLVVSPLVQRLVRVTQVMQGEVPVRQVLVKLAMDFVLHVQELLLLTALLVLNQMQQWVELARASV